MKKNGFFLLQFIILIAAAGAIYTGANYFFNREVNIQKDLEAHRNLTYIHTDIYYWLFSPQACYKTFEGFRFKESPFGLGFSFDEIKSIKNGNGEDVFSSESNDLKTDLRFKEVKINKIKIGDFRKNVFSYEVESVDKEQIKEEYTINGKKYNNCSVKISWMNPDNLNGVTPAYYIDGKPASSVTLGNYCKKIIKKSDGIAKVLIEYIKRNKSFGPEKFEREFWIRLRFWDSTDLEYPHIGNFVDSSKVDTLYGCRAVLPTVDYRPFELSTCTSGLNSSCEVKCISGMRLVNSVSIPSEYSRTWVGLCEK